MTRDVALADLRAARERLSLAADDLDDDDLRDLSFDVNSLIIAVEQGLPVIVRINLGGAR